MINFSRLNKLAQDNRIKNSRNQNNDFFYFDKNKNETMEKEIKDFLNSEEYKNQIDKLNNNQ